MGHITVRYFAAAKAAAGVEQEQLPLQGETTLHAILDAAFERHGSRLRVVATACSVLIGEAPLGDRDPAQVSIRPGDEIHLLPPFAGG